jgi:DNA polymerase-3 subunit delta'
MSEDRPAALLFAEVIGQEAAVSALRAAAAQPVHAYLFVGPAGHGGLAAAHAFAASLLCPDRGCGVCEVCTATLAGRYPDLHVVRRSGAQLSVDDARRVVALAQRRPLQSSRQVVIVPDVHLGERAAPALLKTLEEPPGATVFILLADQLTPDLATVTSRCVTLDFPPVPGSALITWLESRGIAADLASVIADSCNGSPGRAQVMADDPEVTSRAQLWSSLPVRVGPNGEDAAALARQLLQAADEATEALRTEHAHRLEVLTAEAKEMGERALPGRKELLDQFSREERRWRTDALRAGLGALARAYRDRLSASAGSEGAATQVQAAATAVGLITETARSLPRNPNEQLLLQALLIRLGGLPL